MTNYELHIPKALQNTVLTDQFFQFAIYYSANVNLQDLPYFYKVSEKKVIFIK